MLLDKPAPLLIEIVKEPTEPLALGAAAAGAGAGVGAGTLAAGKAAGTATGATAIGVGGGLVRSWLAWVICVCWIGNWASTAVL